MPHAPPRTGIGIGSGFLFLARSGSGSKISPVVLPVVLGVLRSVRFERAFLLSTFTTLARSIGPLRLRIRFRSQPAGATPSPAIRRVRSSRTTLNFKDSPNTKNERCQGGREGLRQPTCTGIHEVWISATVHIKAYCLHAYMQLGGRYSILCICNVRQQNHFAIK